ncbi:MAG: Outer membrane protein assembly factor BamB [Myxococcota bacterium]|nr:Outer membrane protein assembly factor BamB [Myxococcota bacterium]
MGLFASAAGGCTQPVRHFPGAKPVGVKPELEVVRYQWNRTISDKEFLEYKPERTSIAARDPKSNRVFIAGADGVFRSLNADTGEEIWRFDTHEAPFSRPVVEWPFVYFGAGDGVLYAFHVNSSTPRWKYRGDGAAGGTPLIHGNLIVFVTDQARVYAVDKTTGEWKWGYERDLPPKFAIHGFNSPIAAGGHVVVGFPDGKLVGLSPEDGAPAWMLNLASPGEYPSIHRDSAAVDPDAVLVPVYNRGLVLVNARDGKEIRVIQADGPSEPVVYKDRVYAMTRDGVIREYHLATGEPGWSYAVHGGYAGALLLYRDFLVVPMDDSYLYFFDLERRRPAQVVTQGSPFSAAATISGDRLLQMSNGGVLYSFQFWR